MPAPHDASAAQDGSRRFTEYRGFLPFARRASAREVRALWAERATRGPRPVWMHVHVPYCPQICSFCHCGKLLLTQPAQLDAWLARAEDEARFFSPALRGAHVQNLYLGGGTPNLLSPKQLERLMVALRGAFDFAPEGRRTLEVLPSAYRDGTLAVAAAHGINRLSAGVQSSERALLDGVGRAPDLARLEVILREAAALGVDDVNVDLAWRLQGDTEARFFRSVADVLDLGPSTVSVHLLAPTAAHPVYASVADEREVYRQFRGFAEGEGARALARSHPEYVWRALPTVMTLARRDYVDAGRYFTWQYSDMETVEMDMFALGRFGLSHLLGAARYENASPVSEFNPDAPAYRVTRVDGATDGAMDALSHLIRDGRCEPETLRRFYGDDVDELRAKLDALCAEGTLRREGEVYRTDRDPGSLGMGPLSALFSAAEQRARELNAGDDGPPRLIPMRDRRPRAPAPSVTLDVGGAAMAVFVERVVPGRDYCRETRGLGMFYASDGGAPRSAVHDALERLRDALTAEAERGADDLQDLCARTTRALAQHGE
ncbi:MAG: radical SAM protein [Polyangiales bacterium]